MRSFQGVYIFSQSLVLLFPAGGCVKHPLPSAKDLELGAPQKIDDLKMGSVVFSRTHRCYSGLWNLIM